VMPADGVFDMTNEIASVQSLLKSPGLSLDDRAELEERLERLNANRVGAFDTIVESSQQLKSVVRQLEPIAKYSYENIERVVRNT
jgi:transcriptional regulator of aromatic amino acid metabolism